jgi:hypothetical protein
MSERQISRNDIVVRHNVNALLELPSRRSLSKSGSGLKIPAAFFYLVDLMGCVISDMTRVQTKKKTASVLKRPFTYVKTGSGVVNWFVNSGDAC